MTEMTQPPRPTVPQSLWQLPGRHPLLLALLAGPVSATGFAPLQWWPLLFACLALLLWVVARAPTLRSALFAGWLFGVGHFAVGNHWIQHAFDYQDKMPPVLGYVAVLLLALYLALYPAMAAGLAWRCVRIRARDAARHVDAPFVLFFAAAWIVTEWLRGTLFTGYPWNPLGVAWLSVGNVAQAAGAIGTYALSGVSVLAAGALVLALRRRWHMPAAFALLLLAVQILGAPAPVPNYPETHPFVRVVQPNIGQEGTSAPDYPERVLSALIRLSAPRPARAGPELLVWPEGMVNFYVEDGYPEQLYWQARPEVVRARIAGLLRDGDAALVSGNSLLFEDHPEEGVRTLTGAGNSVFVLRRDGALHGRYDKAHLVPYGEYLPLRAVLAPIGLARLVMGEIDFLPGPGPRSIPVAGFGDIGMQVCYEIIFSGHVVDRRHRPAVLFNPSNDAWFGTWGPPQHLAQARMRAIEEGLPILRATPTGISAVIDADGRILDRIEPGVAGAIDVPLPTAHAPTLFSRIGNAMAFLIALALAGVAVAIRRFAR